MRKSTLRSMILFAVVALFVYAVGFAQSSGEAVYKQRCQNCHGSNGLANSGIGQIMKVKPVSDPEVKKLTEVEMIAYTRNGAGKMQAYRGELTDAQIKGSVDYLRSFIK
jgi:mono/diheme cytochrome c family protein